MSIERWNPFQEMLTLRQAMDRLLEESFVRPGGGLLPGAQGMQGMQALQAGFPIDVSETEDTYEVRATLPGVKPEDVQLTVHNDTLLIRGQTRHEEERREGQGQRWLVREHRSQSFQRAISLPTPVDSDRAQARFEDGVLRLTLPKSQAARPRQIQIQGQQGQGQRQAGGQALSVGQVQEGSGSGAQMAGNQQPASGQPGGAEGSTQSSGGG